MLQSKYAVCDIKKSKFVKEQEASGLLSSLGIKTPVKLVSAIFLSNFYSSPNDSPLKTTKNVFYFI